MVTSEHRKSDLTGRKVLVVEDDPQVLDYVCGQLTALGCTCSEAGTLRQALALLDQEAFDLVFTDVALPKGAGGIDLASWVKAVRPQTPVLLTSAYPTEALASADPSVREFPLLRKPYRREDLVAAIGDALRSAA